jgi:integrase
MSKSSTPGIHKRGKTWTAHIHWTDPNGKKQQHKKGGFKTKKAAINYRDQYRSEIQTGRRLGISKIKLADYLPNEWLPQREVDLKQGTFRSYTIIVNTHIIPHLGHLRLEELNARKVESFFTQLQKDGARGQRLPAGSGLSGKTVSNIAGVLNRAMRDAVRWGLIAVNPITDARKPQKKSPEMKAWQPEELGNFIAATRTDRQSGIWHLLATTGMRRGEMLGLRWDDIDFENGTMTIRRTRVRVGTAVFDETPKSQASKRTINIDPQTLQALRQQKARQAEERIAIGGLWDDQLGHIATNRDGSRVDPHALTRRFLLITKKVELPRIRLHDVRHSYVVAARKAGTDVKTISQRIGHADVNVTLTVYDHVFHEDDKQASNATAALLYLHNQ